MNESDDYVGIDIGIGETYRVDLCAQCVDDYREALDRFIHLEGCDRTPVEEVL